MDTPTQLAATREVSTYPTHIVTVVEVDDEDSERDYIRLRVTCSHGCQLPSPVSTMSEAKRVAFKHVTDVESQRSVLRAKLRDAWGRSERHQRMEPPPTLLD